MKRILLFGAIIASSLSLGQMTIDGAAHDSLPCNCYRMSLPVFDQNSKIWSPQTIDLTEDFNFEFNVYFGDADLWGADGLMFVLQSGTEYGHPVFSGGNGLGYKGIPNSVGIEFDMFDSGAGIDPAGGSSDIAADHIALNSNGENNHNVVAPIALPNLEDGDWHDVQILWVPAVNLLTVLVDGTAEMTTTIDLVNEITGSPTGDPNVHWGWTGSTGGIHNYSAVCFDRTAYFTADDASVCPGLPVAFTDASASDLNDWSWSWNFDDGSPIDNSENPSHSYTSPGTYDVELTITDPSGCTSDYQTTITVLDSLSLTMDSTNVTCNGDGDGSAEVTASTGTGPWTYLWDDGAASTTAAITGLSGTMYYTVVVTDDDGCIGTDSVLVEEPAALSATATTIMDAGGSSGSIDLTPSGGTAPYTFLWDNGETTEDVSGLDAGPYEVTITDANGCTYTITFQVASQVGITDIEEFGFTVYPNPSNGAFEIQGEGEYTITITDLQGKVVLTESNSDNTSIDISFVESGIYLLEIQKGEMIGIKKLIKK